MHPSLHSLGHTFWISQFCLNTGSSYLSNNDAVNSGSHGEDGALYLIFGVKSDGGHRFLSRHRGDVPKGPLGPWDGTERGG